MPPPPHKGRRTLIIVVILLALPIALYFLYPLMQTAKEKLDERGEEVAAGEGTGGQTEGVSDDPAMVADGTGGLAGEGEAQRVAELPVIPPAWTLEVHQATIPESRVNGRIEGEEFVMDDARLAEQGPLSILMLRQGTNIYAEREILVYLRPEGGGSLAGSSWNVAKDQRSGAPQVIKRWKSDPRYAPKAKSFSSGYALKLEFDEAPGEGLSGKIYLALPDPEKTVVAGKFKTVAGPTGISTQQAPGTAPATSPQTDQDLRDRYGL
ncbi:MAG TPA: hypothetical protein VMS21_06110 [Methylomirabilota bacterium]|nr:hypothetical protein [Methylomirabilota bacterium]